MSDLLGSAAGQGEVEINQGADVDATRGNTILSLNLNLIAIVIPTTIFRIS
jgi:hypothetical protein